MHIAQGARKRGIGLVILTLHQGLQRSLAESKVRRTKHEAEFPTQGGRRGRGEKIRRTKTSKAVKQPRNTVGSRSGVHDKGGVRERQVHLDPERDVSQRHELALLGLDALAKQGMHQREARLTRHTCEGEIDQHVIIVEMITWNREKDTRERTNKMRERVEVEHRGDEAKTMAVKIIVLNTTSPQAPHSEDSEPGRGHRDAPIGAGHVVKAKA